MICTKCVQAGNALLYGLPNQARKMHSECRYPASCTCQHAVGGEWINDSRASRVP
jgi:hypothetical protein